jgi:hypothetical protein
MKKKDSRELPTLDVKLLEQVIGGVGTGNPWDVSPPPQGTGKDPWSISGYPWKQ